MDEKALFRRARELDPEAIGALYDLYQPAIYRYISHHVGDKLQAQDLTAEVFYRLVEAFHRGQGPDRHLKAWLYRVAHNLVVDHHRHRQRYQMVSLPETLSSEHEDADEAPEVEGEEYWTDEEF